MDDLASVGAVELLRLLQDASPASRGLREICATLRCLECWAALQLERLGEAELIETDADGRFAYAARSPTRTEAADEIARLWRDERRAITSRMLVSPRVPPGPVPPALTAPARQVGEQSPFRSRLRRDQTW